MSFLCADVFTCFVFVFDFFELFFGYDSVSVFLFFLFFRETDLFFNVIAVLYVCMHEKTISNKYCMKNSIMNYELEYLNFGIAKHSESSSASLSVKSLSLYLVYISQLL